jgi:hypothetical protein
LEPVEVDEAEAAKYKHQHGDKCDIWAGEGGQWFIKFKKGACIFIPKAFAFSRSVQVAGQKFTTDRDVPTKIPYLFCLDALIQYSTLDLLAELEYILDCLHGHRLIVLRIAC